MARKWTVVSGVVSIFALISLAASPMFAEGMEGDAVTCFNSAARMYRSGDKAGSFPGFLRAARLGHAGAQLQVGWHYEFGCGVPEDQTLAADWYRRSAEQGNALAMKNLGQQYEFGRGVAEDWIAAARWYAKGTARGEIDSIRALARAFQFGIGVPQNRSRAVALFQRVAQRGDEESGRSVSWLSDPTNNCGFRNAAERDLVIAGRLRFAPSLMGADPAGLTFRNAGERMRWLSGLRESVDREEAQFMQNSRRGSEREAAIYRWMSLGLSRESAEQAVGR